MAHDRSLAKKVLDDSRPKTEKTCLRQGQEPAAENQTRRESRILRNLAPRGDARARGFQNLLLNLYSLVKERLISQAPPNAGESVVLRRLTGSSSAGNNPGTALLPLRFVTDFRRRPSISRGHSAVSRMWRRVGQASNGLPCALPLVPCLQSASSAAGEEL